MLQKLPYKTVLYIPTEYGNQQSIPQPIFRDILDYCLRELIQLNGGATVIDGVGYWLTQAEQIDEMKVKLVLCYVDNLQEGVSLLKELALWIKKETESEAVSFEIGNNLYII